MAKNEKKKLDKSGWKAQFMLVGVAKVNDYTYKMDAKSERSDWVYNSLNLGVDCGSSCGTIYAEMMGGYGSERDNVLYVHGKKENGQDDFENRFVIDWDDREYGDILESIGDGCFITVGLEKDKTGKTFPKKFLSPYDAIAYVKENLKDGTVVNVKGNIEYSVYQDKVQARKRITRVFLSSVDDSSKYAARFSQSMLLKKDSLGKFDKEKGSFPVYATVLEYMKMWKEKEVKQFLPLNKTFEYVVNPENKEGSKRFVEKYLKIKKDVTEIAFDGMFIESGALVTMTVDDLPEDIQELIEIGAYTEEEALAKCTENTGKEKRMVILKPSLKLVGEEGSKVPAVAIVEKKYSEEDLVLDFMLESEEEPEEEYLAEVEAGLEVSDGDVDSWLDSL